MLFWHAEISFCCSSDYFTLVCLWVKQTLICNHCSHVWSVKIFQYKNKNNFQLRKIQNFHTAQGRTMFCRWYERHKFFKQYSSFIFYGFAYWILEKYLDLRLEILKALKPGCSALIISSIKATSCLAWGKNWELEVSTVQISGMRHSLKKLLQLFVCSWRYGWKYVFISYTHNRF